MVLTNDEIILARRKLTPNQRKVFDKLDMLCKGEPDGVAPTALGVALGYEYTSASTRVARVLKTLIEVDLVRRVDFGKGRVLYRTLTNDVEPTGRNRNRPT